MSKNYLIDRTLLTIEGLINNQNEESLYALSFLAKISSEELLGIFRTTSKIIHIDHLFEKLLQHIERPYNMISRTEACITLRNLVFQANSEEIQYMLNNELMNILFKQLVCPT